ncbi:HU family DNA-binding protein [Pseudomonas segetis]|uniref:DNA-binding protein HU-beta n=1 Tax=Pseudomonas segetis TaxID=298908 RepID=A0A239JPF2_9PSED|nr:HU family DNA-binding protein [Pseudomonas segetis]SNT07213.1 DNA-binding protein HU-beta [Pseudomonas segetis]
MNLTKQALIDTITQELGASGTPISKTQVDAVLMRYSVVAARTIKAGGELPLPGIGKLKTIQRVARTGRNPATGAPIDIPAKTTVKLTVSKVLEETINEI